MVFNLNIMDLTIAITSWNKSHFIYIKNNFNKKLSTISLPTKLVKLIKCTGLKKKKKNCLVNSGAMLHCSLQ